MPVKIEEVPWWDTPENDDNWNYGELREIATALFLALIALRAESRWERKIDDACEPFFKTEAEAEADRVLDEARS